MLQKLAVKNYLLIQNLEIGFSGGFSVITGETGAGKSILLGALALVLGQRADASVLLDPSRKCIIEGHFRIDGYQLEEFFRDHELEYEDTLILRRELQENGKSRAFVNDTPVPLSAVKELGDRLVNIHSQHSVVTLNDSNFQMAVMDSYAAIARESQDFRTGFNRFNTARSRLAALEDAEARSTADLDYHRFLLEELDSARLVAGEIEELEQQLDELNHAEEIRGNLDRAGQILSDDEESILTRLAGAVHLTGQAARFKPELQALADRMNSSYIDLKDLAGDLHAAAGHVFTDPQTAEILSQRLDLLNRLLKKHRVAGIAQLLEVRESIAGKLGKAATLEEEIATLKGQIAKMEKELHSLAVALSKKRLRAVPGFEKEVTALLARLGIPKARFKVDLAVLDNLSRDGLNRVNFLFSANQGIGMKELGSAASGGELSRLMLAIKSMISQKNLLPTILFDEIDNGVSGEVAAKVGAILKHMGGFMQVVAITHLPQIAARGEHHYRVFKTEKAQTTSTSIQEIDPQERVEEIARMMSDETVSESAINMAKELLNN